MDELSGQSIKFDTFLLGSGMLNMNEERVLTPIGDFWKFEGCGFGVEGLGFRNLGRRKPRASLDHGLGLRVWGVGLWVWGLGLWCGVNG